MTRLSGDLGSSPHTNQVRRSLKRLLLRDLSLTDVDACGAAIRELGTDASSRAQVAERIVKLFHERFREANDQGAFSLVRCFETCGFEELDEQLQTIARGSCDGAPGTRILRLIATAGDQAEWNDPRKSANHRAIPLPSVEALEQLPMISQVIRQLGVEVNRVLTPDASILLNTVSTNVFHVPEAVGSPSIPVQQGFVIPFAIKSVVGFGDLLPDGRLFVVILFAKVPITQQVATLFSHFSLSVRIALLPFVEIENRLEAELEAKNCLIRNFEEITAYQESRIHHALDDLSQANAELSTANRQLRLEIAQRESVEAELRGANQELRAIYENMADGVLLADAETRQFVFANPAMCRMLGSTPEELLRLSPREIHPSHEVPRILEYFDAMKQGHLVRVADLPYLCRDGSVGYADIHGIRMNYQGRPCVMGIFHDWTAQMGGRGSSHE